MVKFKVMIKTSHLTRRLGRKDGCLHFIFSGGSAPLFLRDKSRGLLQLSNQ